MAGRILDSNETPHDALTIVRDFYLLIEYIERGGDSVNWQAYKKRCRAALTLGNVWGFEPDRPLEQREEIT